jgi:transposase
MRRSRSGGIGVSIARSPWNDLRMQRYCLRLILALVGLFANKERALTRALRTTRKELGALCPPFNTLRNWYKHFQQYGKLPAETARRNRHRRSYKRNQRRGVHAKWQPEQIRILKEIVDANPSYFLDEIARDYHLQFPSDHKSDNDIWKCLHEQIQYSLKVYTETALQRNDNERELYKLALGNMTRRPDMVVFVDETAKDELASRKRRMWTLRGKKAELAARYAPEKDRYTMMGAADINGFILQACEVILRKNGDDDSDESRGTIDKARFVEWVRCYLVPVLGNFARGEPRSIVVMDNAKTHMDSEVERLINEAGAVILYTARYSPDLNPIEYFFRLYKDLLKRNIHERDLIVKHQSALLCVSPSSAANIFRKCFVPGLEHAAQDKELEDLLPTLLPLIFD